MKLGYDEIEQKYGYYVTDSEGADTFCPFSSGGAKVECALYETSSTSTSYTTSPQYMIANNDCTMDYNLSDGQASGTNLHTIAVAVNDVIVDSCAGNVNLTGTIELNEGDKITFQFKTSNTSYRVSIKGSVTFY